MDALLHDLSEQDFCNAVMHLPRCHQDAYRLARYLGVAVRRIARVRAADLLEHGVRVDGKVHLWPSDSPEHLALRARLLAFRTQLAEQERIVDSHKPAAKAALDLEQGFHWGVTLWKQAQHYRARSVEARLPNFVLLGAPKCATTWLHDCLAVHPEVFVPARKELEFFDNHLFEQGFNWYKSFFTGATSQPAVGDTSVGYLAAPGAPEQIRAHLGDRLKFIALLREPVSRAVSWYKYRLLSGNTPPRFVDFVTRYPTRTTCIESGHYVRGLENYLRVFRKEQFLVLLHEDIARDPRGTLRKVFAFLEVDPHLTSEVFATSSNRGQGVRSLHWHYSALRAGVALQNALPYGGLGYRCRRGLNWLNSQLNITQNGGESLIDPHMLELLHEEFAPSNRRLEELFGLDLSTWHAKRLRRAG